MLRQRRRRGGGAGAHMLTFVESFLQLRVAALHEPVSTQYHHLPCLIRRNLTTHPSPSAGKQRIRTDQQGDASRHQRPASSIYPDSRAADRRHPHAPKLFQHFKRHAPGQDGSSQKSSRQRSSSDTYILRNVSSDPELKQLYTSLGMAADAHDAVQATKLCQLIKERKEQIACPSAKIAFEAEERVVFLAVMRALAHHGLLEEVQAINADMLSFGFDQDIHSLNHLLHAAIVCGDERTTAATLEAIFALEPSTSTTSDHSSQLANILLGESNGTNPPRSARGSGLTLPVDTVRNWNVSTFAHMVDSACQDHNLEYALLLLSTCYQLGLALPHESLSRLITLCIHCDEFRAAVELADLMEQGGLVHTDPSSQDATQRGVARVDALRSEARSGQVARRLPPSVWMSMLRSCAHGGYMPGVELAWSKAVTQGLLSPDDGLLQLILALAAKEGSVQMAHICLRHIDPTFDLSTSASAPASPPEPAPGSTRRMPTPPKRMELQEWHLVPLFEAQCTAHDYEGAMRSLHAFHLRGLRLTERTTSRISTSIYPDKACLQLARDALLRCASDKGVGTHKVIVNAVLNAAVWLGDLAQALKLYRAMRSFHPFAGAQGGPPPPNACELVKPNLDTINSLLSGCIDAADYDTGVDLLKDLNYLKLRPTAVTFERMIVLCLTQPNYDDAFGLIEEAKDKDIPPSRKSYEALVRKCFHEKDHRWESVLADMKDQGYRPNPRLLRELEMDAESFSSNPARRSRF